MYEKKRKGEGITCTRFVIARLVDSDRWAATAAGAAAPRAGADEEDGGTAGASTAAPRVGATAATAPETVAAATPVAASAAAPEAASVAAAASAPAAVAATRPAAAPVAVAVAATVAVPAAAAGATTDEGEGTGRKRGREGGERTSDRGGKRCRTGAPPDGPTSPHSMTAPPRGVLRLGSDRHREGGAQSRKGKKGGEGTGDGCRVQSVSSCISP